jgi:hypothetical protein
MVEHSPSHSPQPNWRESLHLNFTQKPLPIEGDPEIPEDFTRALIYLEHITTHFLEFGPIEEKTPFDVAYELSYHNAWHQWEVEQERKAGEKSAEYREINLKQLRALSKRRLLAKAEIGHEDETSIFVDQLIEQAVAEEEAFERMMAPAPNEP